MRHTPTRNIHRCTTLGRRRLLQLALLAPLVALLPGVGLRGAHAAGLPAPLNELDQAVHDLFEAALARKWASARRALQRARSAAAVVSSLEQSYVDAGGALHRFYEAVNALGSDLDEATTALSVRDRRWLSGVADRLIGHVGELSQPFVGSHGEVLPRIMTLAYLSRRMRRAATWNDSEAYRQARTDFDKLWQPLRADLATRLDTARLRAVDEALRQAGGGPDAAAAGALQQALRALLAD